MLIFKNINLRNKINKYLIILLFINFILETKSSLAIINSNLNSYSCTNNTNLGPVTLNSKSYTCDFNKLTQVLLNYKIIPKDKVINQSNYCDYINKKLVTTDTSSPDYGHDYTALFLAVLEADKSLRNQNLINLLSCNANPNLIDTVPAGHTNHTALSIAISRGDTDAVNLLNSVTACISGTKDSTTGIDTNNYYCHTPEECCSSKCTNHKCEPKAKPNPPGIVTNLCGLKVGDKCDISKCCINNLTCDTTSSSSTFNTCINKPDPSDICGDLSQKCCTNNVCNSNTLVCDTTSSSPTFNTCINKPDPSDPCGDLSQKCCSNNICNSDTLVCDTTSSSPTFNTCINKPDPSDTCADLNKDCTDSKCCNDSNNICRATNTVNNITSYTCEVPCLDEAGDSCDSNSTTGRNCCSDNFKCNSNNICCVINNKSCDIDSQCCDNYKCKTNLIGEKVCTAPNSDPDLPSGTAIAGSTGETSGGISPGTVVILFALQAIILYGSTRKWPIWRFWVTKKDEVSGEYKVLSSSYTRIDDAGDWGRIVAESSFSTGGNAGSQALIKAIEQGKFTSEETWGAFASYLRIDSVYNSRIVIEQLNTVPVPFRIAIEKILENTPENIIILGGSDTGKVKVKFSYNYDDGDTQETRTDELDISESIMKKIATNWRTIVVNGDPGQELIRPGTDRPPVIVQRNNFPDPVQIRVAQEYIKEDWNPDFIINSEKASGKYSRWIDFVKDNPKLAREIYGIARYLLMDPSDPDHEPTRDGLASFYSKIVKILQDKNIVEEFNPIGDSGIQTQLGWPDFFGTLDRSGNSGFIKGRILFTADGIVLSSQQISDFSAIYNSNEFSYLRERALNLIGKSNSDFGFFSNETKARAFAAFLQEQEWRIEAGLPVDYAPEEG